MNHPHEAITPTPCPDKTPHTGLKPAWFNNQKVSGKYRIFGRNIR